MSAYRVGIQILLLSTFILYAHSVVTFKSYCLDTVSMLYIMRFVLVFTMYAYGMNSMIALNEYCFGIIFVLQSYCISVVFVLYSYSTQKCMDAAFVLCSCRIRSVLVVVLCCVVFVVDDY